MTNAGSEEPVPRAPAEPTSESRSAAKGHDSPADQGPLFNECIHCGFCLPVCPTYDVLGTEMDSPRGRLYLMRALEEGTIQAAEPVVRHLDLCLGCRACETECPSGVPFGEHLAKARARLRDSPARPAGQRVLESLVLRAVALPPGLQKAGAFGLRILAGLSRRGSGAQGHLDGVSADLGHTPQCNDGPLGGRATLRAKLGSVLRLLESAEPRPASLPTITPARGDRQQRIGFLEGCVNRWIFGNVNEAAVRLLAAVGCEVIAPRGQRCCGALHVHSGDRRGARALARANIAAFERAGALDAIVVTSAGCGSAMKEYGSLFEEDREWGPRAARFAAKVKDALEVLAETGMPPERREMRSTVAYHDACHLAHAQGIRLQPRALLQSIPGLALVPLADSDRCCGSAGLYNLLHPDVAGVLLRAKIERLRASGASIIAAANPGCLMHLAAGARESGLHVRVAHPIELLDESCSPRT